MANVVVMPKAGISVESCIIGQWKKSPGDKVSMGEVLFDYETDKASFECESTAEGTLLECFYGDGDEVPCLTAVCAVGEAGEDVSSLRPDGAPAGEAAPEEAPAPTVQAVVETAPIPQSTERTAEGVSPRARGLAEKLRVNPTDASPTGPRGRVIVRDVEALADSGRTGRGIGGRTFGEEAPAAEPADVQVSEYTDEKFTKIRKTIASQMHKSLAEMAQLTHHHSFDASGILSYRKNCKNGAETFGTGGISLNDMVMFGVVKTLKDHPDLNAHLIGGDTLRRFHNVNLGLAVDTPRGLMVPTIFGADKMSLKELSDKAKELAAMCQSGSINPDLLQGATFTVSNLGALGVEIFTPIINPPQVGILGVCGMTTRVRDGKDGLETYKAIGLSLTYDHRAVDGAPASRFVKDLSNNLEQFGLLLAL